MSESMIFNVISLSSISKILLHSILQNNILNLNTPHHTRLVSRKSQSGVKWTPRKCCFLRCKGLVSHSHHQQGWTIVLCTRTAATSECGPKACASNPHLRCPVSVSLTTTQGGLSTKWQKYPFKMTLCTDLNSFVKLIEKEQILKYRSQNCRANKCKCALSAGTSALEY